MPRVKTTPTYQPRKLSPLHGRLMGLLTRAGISDDERHNLVYAWTKGRTQSSVELTGDELRDLVWKFENQYTAAGNEATGTRAGINLEVEYEMKRLRSIILKIASHVGIKEPDSFTTFNHFMVNRSILKKPLHKYTLSELTELRMQFHQIEKNYDRSAENGGTKAWFHKQQMPGVGAN